MSDEVKKFMASKTFYRCERLNANLTVEQCAANRSRQTSFASQTVAIMQCEDCAGLGKAVEMIERVKPAAISRKRTKLASMVMALDFSEHVELYERIQAADCSPHDVIGLLYMLFDNELAVVKDRRKAA